VLVPRKNNMKEIHDLSSEERYVLMDEITKASLAVKVQSPAVRASL
jgi:diadenosine tetraphosphate (Ap4A) HIT family hydrolase